MVPASVSRTGLQVYRTADGKQHTEYRPDSEVFAPEAMASLRAAAVTVGHTPERTPRSVGVASDREPARAKRGDEEYLETDLIITDQETARRIDAKELTEISLDYWAKVDATPGEYKGQRYDARQTDIRIHSVALLPTGQARAGREARIRLDGNEELCNEENTDMNATQTQIVKLKIGDRLVDQGGAEHISLLEADVARERSRADALQTQLTAAQTQATTEKARADGLAAAPPPDVNALVLAELAFRDSARPLLAAGYDFTGKSRAQVMRDAVGAEACARCDAQPEATRPVYLQVTFDSAVAAKKNGAPAYPLAPAGAPRADAQSTFLSKLDAGFKGPAGGSK